MFVMRDLNPYDPFGRGLGQSEPLADEIEIDEYAAKFQKNFFLNDATPATIISGEDLTEEQRNPGWKLPGMNPIKGCATATARPF